LTDYRNDAIGHLRTGDEAFSAQARECLDRQRPTLEPRPMEPRHGVKRKAWADAATTAMGLARDSCRASAAGAHTRSQSHSVWEIKGAEVDLVMTIPVLEADRLSSVRVRHPTIV